MPSTLNPLKFLHSQSEANHTSPPTESTPSTSDQTVPPSPSSPTSSPSEPTPPPTSTYPHPSPRIPLEGAQAKPDQTLPPRYLGYHLTPHSQTPHDITFQYPLSRRPPSPQSPSGHGPNLCNQHTSTTTGEPNSVVVKGETLGEFERALEGVEGVERWVRRWVGRSWGRAKGGGGR